MRSRKSRSFARFLFPLGLSLLIVGPAWPCSLIILPPPLSELDYSLVFTGTVEATDSYDVPGRDLKAPGVVIAVDEVLVGSSDLSTVTVFLYGYGNDCSPGPAPYYLDHYQPGMFVSVIVDELYTDDGSLYLGAHSSTPGFIAFTPRDGDRDRTGVLDFRLSRESYEPNRYETWSREVSFRNSQREWLEDVEYVRALQILAESPPDLRCEIAMNLTHYHRWRGYRFLSALQDFEQLLEEYQVPVECRSAIVETFKKIAPLRP